MFDGDLKVAAGAAVHLRRGHTPRLQRIAVRTARHVYHIASDNVDLTEMWNAQKQGGAPHWPGSFPVDLETCLASLNRTESLGDVILPIYDAIVREQREYR